MQEDKEGLFDTVDTLLSTLDVFAGMVRTLRFNADRMKGALGRGLGLKARPEGYILATDLADYLVRKGESFRAAHDIVGRLVSYAAGKGKTFAQLDIKEYRQFSKLFDDEVRKITVRSSLAARDVPGGTAPRRVRQSLKRARKLVG